MAKCTKEGSNGSFKSTPSILISTPCVCATLPTSPPCHSFFFIILFLPLFLILFSIGGILFEAPVYLAPSQDFPPSFVSSNRSFYHISLPYSNRRKKKEIYAGPRAEKDFRADLSGFPIYYLPSRSPDATARCRSLKKNSERKRGRR